MAEKILSQDEVDALLRGVETGQVDTTPKEEEAQPKSSAYDFLSQDRSARRRMPLYEMVMDRFIRQQATTWANTTREPVDFSLVETRFLKFGEFIKKIPLPSSLTIFTMEPLRGQCLFVMDAFLVYLLVDHFFGGSGQTHVKPEGRDFTPVQQRVIKTVVEQSLADLEKAWQTAMPLRISVVRSESNSQFATIVSGTDTVLTSTLQFALGEHTRDFYIAYPSALLEPIQEKLYSGLISGDPERTRVWGARFRGELQGCQVQATGQLGTATVRVRDVLNFSSGDVLVLDQSPGDLMNLLVEGVPKFQGSAGVVRGNQAFRIARALSARDE